MRMEIPGANRDHVILARPEKFDFFDLGKFLSQLSHFFMDPSDSVHITLFADSDKGGPGAGDHSPGSAGVNGVLGVDSSFPDS